MSVAALARGYQGVATWQFSQSNFGTWIHYRTMGICAGLSAEWIRYHAEGDSLANHLGSGGVGRLNTGMVREIHSLHETASAGTAQATQLGLWLRMHDIVELQRSYSVTTYSNRLGRDVWRASSVSAEQMGGADGGNPINGFEIQIVDAMRRLRSKGCYVRINFGGRAFGRTAGHAVAAWLGAPTYRVQVTRPGGQLTETRVASSAGDACFFDPNYGEFWFQNKNDFFNFFPHFYRDKYITRLIKFNQRWEVIPCAKRVI